MNLQMQYPSIQGNQLCDGRVHSINATALNRIDGFELYLLDYFDEVYACDCSTVLVKKDGCFKKIPLLDYDLLFSMLDKEQLDLIPVQLSEIMRNNANLFIAAEPPRQDISVPLTQARRAIVIYIANDGTLYVNVGNGFERITADQLSAFMQGYDIEWRYKESNELASPEDIDIAINNHLGHQDGLSVKERYHFGNIRHYSVGYSKVDENGNIRGNYSI